MSYICSNHASHKLNMVCIDRKCTSNELICHYCLFEKHSGHIVYPIELFLEIFEKNFSNENVKFDLLKMQGRVSDFQEIKDKYLVKLNDFQKTFNLTIETLKSKLTNIFGGDSEIQYLQKAMKILELQKNFQYRRPKTNSEFQILINSYLDLFSKEKENSDFGHINLKSINNGLDLSLFRLTMFDTKLTKTIQKAIRSLEIDFRFVQNQISLVIFILAI